jgi:formylglycine-generating enzyme required for sulfatase activity
MKQARSFLIVAALILGISGSSPAEPGRAASLAVPEGFSAIGSDRDSASGLPMRIRHDRTGYELVYVPAGSVLLGMPESDQYAMPDETPVTRVFLPGYWIGRCEVTNAQFRLFRASHRSGGYKGHTLDGDSQPVVNVSWEDAAAFCEWSGMRLPSEAEWEKAARGSDQRLYAWGNEWPPRRLVGNFGDGTAARSFPSLFGPEKLEAVSGYDDRYAVTAPVGSFPDGASPYGALDMTGNVQEWCRDGWDARVTRMAKEVFPNITDEEVREYRMHRGGQYFGNDVSLRAASRESNPLDYREDSLGFRAALSPVSSKP